MKKIVFVMILLLVALNFYALVKLSGNIKNHVDKTIQIRMRTKKGEGIIIKAIPVDKNGNFSSEFKISNKNYYFFYTGNQYTEIYLKPDYNLRIELDYKDFDNSIKFSGNGKKINDYLKFRQLTDIGFRNDFEKNYKLNEEDFKNKLSKLKKQKLEELKKIKNEPDFVKIEKKRIQYDYLIKLMLYQRYHRYVTKDHNFIASKKIYDEFKNIDFNNEKELDTVYEYGVLLTEYFIGSIQEGKEGLKRVLPEFDKIKSVKIRDLIFAQLFRELSPSYDYADKIKDILIKIATTQNDVNKVENKYEQVKKLLPGKTAPNFAYKDLKGKLHRLSDFKGKYVYVDVWATWCGPCKAQIPYLKNLAEKFKNKDIQFISVSIDNKKDYDVWKNFISEHQMSWLQLFADKDWKSDIVKNYIINGIPHFILIDKNGKIINSHEMRPSNTELGKKLEKLLKGKKI